MSNNCCNTCNTDTCSCKTVCPTPVVCIKPTKPKPTKGKLVVDDILRLLEEKCDKAKCETIETRLDDLDTAIESRCEDIEEMLDGLNTIDESKIHHNYTNVDDTFEDMVTPDGSTIPYAKKLNVGDTIVIGNCVYENMLIDNQTRPETDTTNGWFSLCEVNELVSSNCSNEKGVLRFSSCDELSAYDGTEKCPLYDGMLAIVQNSDGCFDIYAGKWFTDTAGIDNDNDACGDHLTHHTEGEECKEFRWKSYESCHPDVFVTGNSLTIVGDKITSTITRSDGEVFTDNVTITHPVPPTPVLTSSKVKMDIETTLSIPVGVDTPYTLLGSSTAAPVSGWYQMSGATAGEITNYNTVCVNPGDARAEAFYQFKVGSTIVGENPFQSSYATNVVNDKELVIAGGAGFSVYLEAGQKIDVYVSHRKHAGAYCTATHNVYLEGLTYELN